MEVKGSGRAAMDDEPALNFKIALFGRVQFNGPEGKIELTSKKLAALLAYLCLTHPTPHTREKLLTLLWGRQFDTQGRQNLRKTLSNLRRTFGEDVIVSISDTISLRPGLISCDVISFEMLISEGSDDSLHRALDLYKDQLLVDLKLSEEGWSRWLSREQQRLEEMAINAALTLGEAEFARGNADQAMEFAKRAVAINSFREDAHRLFMRAASMAGRTAQALQHFDSLVVLLDRELDVRPDEITSRLATEIRAKAGSSSAPAEKTVSKISGHQSRIFAHCERESNDTVLALDAATGNGLPNVQGLLNATAQLVHNCGARIINSGRSTLLVQFPDPRMAVKAAHATRAHSLRMSAHASPSQDLAGDVASRLVVLSAPGHLLVSNEVRDTLIDGLDAHIEDFGEHNIGSAADPVRAYRAGPPENTSGHDAAGVHLRIQPAVAVIPFSISSPEPEQRIIGQLLAHEIITRLSQVKEFAVISRMSTRAFCGRSARLSDIGAWLGADYAVWGDCQVRGERLSVQFEVANIGSEAVIWAGTHVIPVSAVEKGYAEVVDHIVAETNAAVLGHELARTQSMPLDSLENYSLLMAAINLVHRTAPSSFGQARDLLDLLIKRLPHHPLPHAWMAQWHVMKVNQGWADDVAAEGRLALEYASRASDGDPNCSIAIAMDGWVHTHLLKRFDIAVERLERAVELNSNDSMAWLLKGAMHSFLGQGKEAIQAAERAMRLSPLDPRRSYYECLAAAAYCSANFFDRAIELGRRSLRVNRLHSSTLRSLTCSLALSGRMDDARQMAAELMKLEPKLTVRTYLSRHPAASFWTGKTWAEALRRAGVPD
jgi:adenylate cyclase